MSAARPSPIKQPKIRRKTRNRGENCGEVVIIETAKSQKPYSFVFTVCQPASSAIN